MTSLMEQLYYKQIITKGMDKENKYGTLGAQIRLLELLKEFHAFCVRNGIKYSLAYGSLLGAIRHNGFIPWDDDLDVFVDRKSYDVLVEKLSADNILDVSMDSLWVDRVRYRKDMSAKGYRPTLDILVLDNVPASGFTRKLKLFKILALQGMMKPHPSFNKGSFVMRLCSYITFCLGKFFSSKWKRKVYITVSKQGQPSGKVANYNGEFADLRRTYPATIMNSIIEHSFEDTKAFIVADYDMCLKTQFGDYMTPPKESDRKPRHGA